MKKIIGLLLVMFVGLACYVAGFFQGLDEKETMKQSFRTALYHAQNNLKSLQLQSQADTDELWSMTQQSLEQNLQSLVLAYMTGNEIEQSSFQSAQNLIKDVNDFAAQQNMILFADKKHWRFPETVSYIQSNLKNMVDGKPADNSVLDKLADEEGFVYIPE